ncbi:MAG: hypothetical protein Kow00107_02590 [Planctomycetota bacterium]
MRPSLSAFTILIALFLAPSFVWAEDYSASLPLGGYFRDRTITPVTFSAATYGNPGRYKISIQSGITSALIFDGFSLGPREKKSVVLPVEVTPEASGLYLVVTNLLAPGRPEVFSKDLTTELRPLYQNDRLVLCSGITMTGAENLPLTVPGRNVKFVTAQPDSGAFDNWYFLEVADMICVFNCNSEDWTPERLLALSQWVEQGGNIVLSSWRSSRVAEALVPMAAGWDGESVPPDGSLDYSPGLYASYPLGLGKVVLSAHGIQSKENEKAFWEFVASLCADCASPVSSIGSMSLEGLDAPAIMGLFPEVEIPPTTARDLMLVAIIIFIAFLFGAAFLYSVKGAAKLWAVLVVFAVVGISLSLAIHNFIKRPGIFWRYRLFVETGPDGKGSGALFCSLSSSSEKSTAVIIPEGASAKIVDSTKSAVIEDSPTTPSILRGVYVGIRKPTVIMIRFPLSSVSAEQLVTLKKPIYEMTEETQNQAGTILHRRFISATDDQVRIGLKGYARRDFTEMLSPPEGFDKAEWAFLKMGCRRCSATSAVANLYWPVNENGEIKTDEITRIDWRRIEDAAAILFVAPPSRLVPVSND